MAGVREGGGPPQPLHPKEHVSTWGGSPSVSCLSWTVAVTRVFGPFWDPQFVPFVFLKYTNLPKPPPNQKHSPKIRN